MSARGMRLQRAASLVVLSALASTGGPAPAFATDPVFEAMAVSHVSPEAPAPDFTLPSADGKQAVTVAELRGKAVFLNFWATWCPPCREEMPSMERLYRDFKDQGLVILAVNVQESPKQVARFMRDFRLSFPALLDADLKVAQLYQVRGLPMTYLIDRDGRLVGRAVGPRDWASPESRALVRSLLAAPRTRNDPSELGSP